MSKEIQDKIRNLRDIQSKLNALRTPGFTDVPLGAGGIKGLIKRVVRKNVLWMLAPYEEQLNARIGMERYLIDEIGNILTALEREQSACTAKLDETALKLVRDEFDEVKYREDESGVMRAAMRELMKQKWERIDEKRAESESADDVLTCRICGSQHKRSEYRTMTAECQFGGGELERYVCPDCGAVFGPSKFAALTDDEKGADYALHYRAYDEGDSQEKEVEAFYMLNPNKDGVYLDYGCGRWSGAVSLLREQGYNVYGYEPYASETGNPYIITDKQEVCRMKFDGIFSNDLAEHLFDPVEDFRFMRSLLRDENSKMSHSTSCYEYKHEDTRFHMNFFLGNSVSVLCEKSGFKLLERRDELEERDFICCVFGIDGDFKKQYGDEGLNLLPKLFYKDERLTGKQEQKLESGDVLYGPYITCAPMKYRLNIRAVTMETVGVKITSMKGAKTLAEARISYGDNIVEFSCSEVEYDTEIIITNDSLNKAEITGVFLI